MDIVTQYGVILDGVSDRILVLLITYMCNYKEL
jgi:phosphatidylglycerophosphate synthase